MRIKKIHINRLIVILLACLIVFTSHAAAQKRAPRSHRNKVGVHKRVRAVKKTPLEDVFLRLEKHNSVLLSLRADLTMDRFNAQLRVSDVRKGVVIYLPRTLKRPMYLRLDWSKPFEEQMVIIGNSFQLYRPKLNQVIVGKPKQFDSIFNFADMSKGQFRENFRANYVGKERIKDGVVSSHVELVPIKQFDYTSVDIWVDNDGMLRQAKVTEKNSDSTTVLLSNPAKNVTLDGRIFKLIYPASVKKIRM